MSIDLPGNDMLGLPREALVALRGVLFRQDSAAAASALYEAGYAGGEALHSAFVRWCRSRKLAMPENMGAPEFGQHLSTFLAELGLGTITLGSETEAVVTIDTTNWAEADPASAMQFPGCYLSAGMLTEFFARVAGAPVAVMEVECRSTGAGRCRFIVGSAETIQQVYEAMAQGSSYEVVLSA